MNVRVVRRNNFSKKLVVCALCFIFGIDLFDSGSFSKTLSIRGFEFEKQRSTVSVPDGEFAYFLSSSSCSNNATIVVGVEMANLPIEINKANVLIQYNKDILSPISIDPGGSFFDVLTSSSIDYTKGIIACEVRNNFDCLETQQNDLIVNIEFEVLLESCADSSLSLVSFLSNGNSVSSCAGVTVSPKILEQLPPRILYSESPYVESFNWVSKGVFDESCGAAAEFELIAHIPCYEFLMPSFQIFGEGVEGAIEVVSITELGDGRYLFKADIGIEGINPFEFNCSSEAILFFRLDGPCGVLKEFYYSDFYQDLSPPFLEDNLQDVYVDPIVGSCGNNVTWEDPVVLDNCSGIVGVESAYSSGDFFSSGATEVEYAFEDICGNITSESFNVVVGESSVLRYRIQLAGADKLQYKKFERCLAVKFIGASENLEIFAPVVFLGGDFGAPAVAEGTFSIPCGQYESVCIKDESHTLQKKSKIVLDPIENEYRIDAFLELGDINNDNIVSLLDLAAAAGQVGNVLPVNTSCKSNNLHADFDGDGIVTTLDLLQIVLSYYGDSGDSCSGFFK